MSSLAKNKVAMLIIFTVGTHRAKVATRIALHIDTDVVRSTVVITVDTLAIASPARQCHASRTALLQRAALDVDIGRRTIEQKPSGRQKGNELHH